MTGSSPRVVRECWRFPVKSMQGMSVPELEVTPTGVSGDRTHGLLGGGHLLSAKRHRDLLMASADDESITLPDGRRIALDDPGADAALSAWLGREVELRRPGSDEAVSYEMTFDPPNEDAEVYEIPAPPGTFLDYAPLHVLTTATLAACAERRADLDWDRRRFRANVVIDGDGEAFAENGWVGAELAVGDEVVLRVMGPSVRCAMPLRAQPGLERQPGLFKAMEELNAAMPNHLGAYAEVVRPGTVRVGDAVVVSWPAASTAST